MKTIIRRTRNALALVFVAFLLLTVARAFPVPSTQAAWNDREHTRSTFTAAELAPVTNFQCQTVNVLLKTNARLSWNPPTGGLPAGTMYELEIINTTTVPGESVSIFTTNTQYELSEGLLTGLLSGLLKGNADLTANVFVVIPDSMTNPQSPIWRTLPPVPTAPLRYQGNLLTGSFSCV